MKSDYYGVRCLDLIGRIRPLMIRIQGMNVFCAMIDISPGMPFNLVLG